MSDRKDSDGTCSDLGSSLGRLLWDLADLRSYTTIMPLFYHPLHPMEFCFWFPISILCLSLSTVKNFNHTLIQPFCVDLKTGSHFLVIPLFY